MLKNQISITSISGNKIEDIELLELATMFFLKELNKITCYSPIICDIIISDSVKSEATGELLSGDMCERIDDSGNIRYVCTLADYVNSIETIRTLAHELVHTWQTATGKLQIRNDIWFWEDKSYGTEPYVGNDCDYILPWEIEADILDVQLVKQFLTSYLEG